MKYLRVASVKVQSDQSDCRFTEQSLLSNHNIHILNKQQSPYQTLRSLIRGAGYARLGTKWLESRQEVRTFTYGLLGVGSGSICTLPAGSLATSDFVI